MEATDGEAWAARATRELRRLLRLDGAGEEERGAAKEAADGEAWAANATRELRRLLGLEVGGQEGPSDRRTQLSPQAAPFKPKELPGEAHGGPGGSGTAETWVVRFVKPGGTLLLQALAGGKDGAPPREMEVQRDAVAEHVERRREVWGVGGVGATVRATDATLLIWDDRGATPRVRVVSAVEKFRLQGMSAEDLELARGAPWKTRRAANAQETSVAARVQHSVLSAALVTRAAVRLEAMGNR